MKTTITEFGFQAQDRVNIVFGNLDWSIVETITHRRSDPKENFNSTYSLVNGRQNRKKTPFETHLMGFAAEMAVARYLDIVPDFHTSSIYGDGNQKDLVLPNGKTLQVKCRTEQWHDWALNDGNLSSFKDDYGVLVYADKDFVYSRKFTIAGVISRDGFTKKHKIIHTYGVRLAISSRDMDSIIEFKKSLL